MAANKKQADDQPGAEAPQEAQGEAKGFTAAQLAQIKALIADASADAYEQGRAAGAASVPQLPDDQMKAQQRLADQGEAAKRPHPVQDGSLRHMQSLRDGTVIHGQKKIIKGEEVHVETQVQYRNTPDGKIIVGGPYDGKYL